MAERKAAQPRALSVDETKIRLQLTTTLDPALYDLPLTLETKTPPAWSKCRVTQAGTTITVPLTAGVVRYNVIPGPAEILLEAAP